jgi:hypothetical protein
VTGVQTCALPIYWHESEHPNPFRQTMVRLGKGTAGRLLDGVQYDGVPVVGGAR